MANPEHILDADDTILVNQEEFPMKPETILETKEKHLRRRTIREVLVKWNGYPIEDASWEDWDKLVAQFPHLKDWNLFLLYTRSACKPLCFCNLFDIYIYIGSIMFGKGDHKQDSYSDP